MALPQGYREGLVTAISVFLGFSLYFARWWNLEHPDEWTWQGVVPACIVGAGIVVQLIALYRSLDVRDENEARYRRTVQYFFSGVLIVLVGVVIVTIVN
jgi:drug/metabolite transporter superfamily protein YnfA